MKLRVFLAVFLFFILISPTLYFYYGWSADTLFKDKNLKITFKKGSAFIPFWVNLERIEFNWQNEIILSIPYIKVKFNPFSLFWGELKLEELKMPPVIFQIGEYRFSNVSLKIIFDSAGIPSLELKGQKKMANFYLKYKNNNLSFSLFIPSYHYFWKGKNICFHKIKLSGWGVRKDGFKLKFVKGEVADFIFQKIRLSRVKFKLLPSFNGYNLIIENYPSLKGSFSLAENFNLKRGKLETLNYPLDDGKLSFKVEFLNDKCLVKSFSWKGKKFDLKTSSFFLANNSKKGKWEKVDWIRLSSNFQQLKITIWNSSYFLTDKYVTIKGKAVLSFPYFKLEEKVELKYLWGISTLFINSSFLKGSISLKTGDILFSLKRDFVFKGLFLKLKVLGSGNYLNHNLTLKQLNLGVKNYFFALEKPLFLKWGKEFYFTPLYFKEKKGGHFSLFKENGKLYLSGKGKKIFNNFKDSNLEFLAFLGEKRKKIYLDYLKIDDFFTFSKGNFKVNFNLSDFYFKGKGRSKIYWDITQQKLYFISRLFSSFIKMSLNFSRSSQENNFFQRYFAFLKGLPFQYEIFIKTLKIDLAFKEGKVFLNGDKEKLIKEEKRFWLNFNLYSDKGNFSYDEKRFSLVSFYLLWSGDPLLILPYYRIDLSTKYRNLTLSFCYDSQLSNQWRVASNPPISQDKLLLLISGWKLDFLREFAGGRDFFKSGTYFFLSRFSKKLKNDFKLDDFSIVRKDEKFNFYLRKKLANDLFFSYQAPLANDFVSGDEKMSLEYLLKKGASLKLEKDDDDTILKFQYKFKFGK